jgi:hypothetical protein
MVGFGSGIKHPGSATLPVRYSIIFVSKHYQVYIPVRNSEGKSVLTFSGLFGYRIRYSAFLLAEYRFVTKLVSQVSL